jgi:hypothetical protein
MKRSLFTEEQIIAFLAKQEGGRAGGGPAQKARAQLANLNICALARRRASGRGLAAQRETSGLTLTEDSAGGFPRRCGHAILRHARRNIDHRHTRG